MDTRRYLTLSGEGKPSNWPPLDQKPYTLPPYIGDRDLWFTPPDKPDIRFCRGDEWSMVVPGLAYLPGITSLEYPERCMTGFYPIWDDKNRQMIREAYAPRYTHFTLWLADIYHYKGGITPSQLVKYCLELRKAGIPFIRAWLGSKNWNEWIPHDQSAQVWMDRLIPYLDALVKEDCIHHAVMGGEYDLWNIGVANDPTSFQIAESLVQRYSPKVLIYFHFSTHVTFWDNCPGSWKSQRINDRFDWTRLMCDEGVRGMGYQGACPKEWTIPDLQARLVDSLGKVDSRWDIVSEEPGPADAQFPANAYPDEIDAAAIGYAAIITKPYAGATNVNVMGYLNGGWKPSGKYL